DGMIQQLEVMNGHPLLQQSALEAIRQWRYQPTLINGEPVEVDTTIDVIFSLNQYYGPACQSWDRHVTPSSSKHTRWRPLDRRHLKLRSKRMVATLNVIAVFLLQEAPTFDLRSMWGSMTLLVKVVVFILFILSVYSFGVMIDRALMYSAARKQSRVFVQQVAGALKEGKLDEAIAIAERNKKSHIAKVVATGLSEFQAASQQVSDSDV